MLSRIIAPEYLDVVNDAAVFIDDRKIAQVRMHIRGRWTNLRQMTPPRKYYFQWDDRKARENARKHGLHFEDAVALFQDPLALTRYDVEHSESEDRWHTVGQIKEGMLVVVSHTFGAYGATADSVRIISARKATPQERREYESGKFKVKEPSPAYTEPVMKDDEEMPAEIDFSNGERGKFYRENAALVYPVYLDPQVLVFFKARAAEHGTNLATFLNRILLREMAQIQSGR